MYTFLLLVGLGFQLNAAAVAGPLGDVVFIFQIKYFEDESRLSYLPVIALAQNVPQEIGFLAARYVRNYEESVDEPFKPHYIEINPITKDNVLAIDCLSPEDKEAIALMNLNTQFEVVTLVASLEAGNTMLLRADLFKNPAAVVLYSEEDPNEIDLLEEFFFQL